MYDLLRKQERHIVYHGTGEYNLKDFRNSLPIKRTRSYLSGRKAFSATTDFDVAALFALRCSSVEDFLYGKISGIVLEFDLVGEKDKDYIVARDPCSLQKESEIAVFNVHKLKLRTVWRFYKGKWSITDL